MEFRVGDNLRSSYLPPSSAPATSNGYFASEAIRAGLLGADQPRVPAREALMRELQKDQIREEMRAREGAQRRALEEEVRREMEFERTMAARRHESDRLNLLYRPPPRYPQLPRYPELVAPSEPGARLAPAMTPVLRFPEAGFHERVPYQPQPRAGESLRPQLGFDERVPYPMHSRVVEPVRSQPGFDERVPYPMHSRVVEPVRSQPGFDEIVPYPMHSRVVEPVRSQPGFDEIVPYPMHSRVVEPIRSQPGFDVRSRLLPRRQPPPRPVFRKNPPVPRHRPEFNEKKVEEQKTLSGTKRKADTGGAEKTKKWSCSVCEVSTTGAQALKEHMQGKKHKAKVEESNGTPAKALEEEEKKAEGVAKKMKSSEEEEGKQQPPSVAASSEERAEIWCELCKLKCNSMVMLNSHLSGKKHKYRVEESKKKKHPDVAASSTTPKKDSSKKPVAAPPTAKKAKKQKEEVKGDGPSSEAAAPAAAKEEKIA